jgi:hypothetical protein
MARAFLVRYLNGGPHVQEADPEPGAGTRRALPPEARKVVIQSWKNFWVGIGAGH